ncbi:MAG: hypothetical protein KatS3mg008_1372 [Acidimicrobiales bacterium]|nr:MAG: hypothetical protein KatS3mg008_1372 [Acidimicrobiales bacterium]
MSLSERLARARQEREGRGGSGYLLRFAVEEGRHFDGRDLRTGEPLTPERLEELRRRQGMIRLPKWRPAVDRKRLCPRCQGEPRVSMVDLIGERTQLSCDACGITWVVPLQVGDSTGSAGSSGTGVDDGREDDGPESPQHAPAE